MNDNSVMNYLADNKILCYNIIPWKNKMAVYMYDVGYFTAKGTQILSRLDSVDYLIQVGDSTTECFISNKVIFCISRQSSSGSATLFDVGTIKKSNNCNFKII